MIDYRVKFEEVKNKSLRELESLIGQRDNLCKRYVSKIYRQTRSLGGAYELFYKSTLWKECVKPLLVAWGMKKGIIDPNICPNCSKILVSWKQIVPHHVKYPPLAKKYKYRGFDGRVVMNKTNKIKFMCIECHPEHHKKLRGSK